MAGRTYIVILNWNAAKHTAVCLESVRQLRHDNYTAVVVDNGSTDDSTSRLRDQFPWATLIPTGKNLGFAAGCNVGIRRAQADGADFVWLLNNDTIVHPDALGALVAKATSDPKIGAVGSAVYHMEQPARLQAWGGGAINFLLGRGDHFLKPMPDEALDFITGASLFLPRGTIETVGLLDDGFFMYWEDSDYCFRIRKAGLKLAVAGECRVWHEQCGSVGRKSVELDHYFNSSAARFFRKHAALPLFSLWVGCAMRLSKRVLLGDWRRTKAIWLAATQRQAVR
jgi:GT2 family glycosyltransferase